jgi:hypothetical protein
MKLGDMNLDELIADVSDGRRADGRGAGNSRLSRVLALLGQVSSEDGKSPETVAAIRSLKKLVPGAIVAAIVAITIVASSIVYTAWGALHGTPQGGPALIAGATAIAAILLIGFYTIAKRTFGKGWYTYRDSLDL